MFKPFLPDFLPDFLCFVAPAPNAPLEVRPRFQREADAMLKGCAMTLPCEGTYFEERYDGLHACAIASMYLGMGETDYDYIEKMGENANTAMEKAYYERYGVWIQQDNDDNHRSREEIAARIAAL